MPYIAALCVYCIVDDGFSRRMQNNMRNPRAEIFAMIMMESMKI